jgi:hypothetical protein
MLPAGQLGSAMTDDSSCINVTPIFNSWDIATTTSTSVMVASTANDATVLSIAVNARVNYNARLAAAGNEQYLLLLKDGIHLEVLPRSVNCRGLTRASAQLPTNGCSRLYGADQRRWSELIKSFSASTSSEGDPATFKPLYLWRLRMRSHALPCEQWKN